MPQHLDLAVLAGVRAELRYAGAAHSGERDLREMREVSRYRPPSTATWACLGIHRQGGVTSIQCDAEALDLTGWAFSRMPL